MKSALAASLSDSLEAAVQLGKYAIQIASTWNHQIVVRDALFWQFLILLGRHHTGSAIWCGLLRESVERQLKNGGLLIIWP
jgi:hypothetical protein